MKKKEFKRFEKHTSFRLFGYTIRITKDRPDWSKRKKGVVELSK